MTGTARFRNGRVRVLIVDDEPALTDVLSVAVAEAGWRACPALDGQSALRIARGCAPHAVVLDGLGAGADDYVTKPFSLEEVVLRLRGLLRRAAAERTRSGDRVRVLGDLVLTEETREVHRVGVPVQLTAKEFDLLSLLMGHPRQVLSKAQILAHVWSSSFDGGGNLVEVYVAGLRRKIDRGRAPMIHTVRGLGYVIRPVEDGR
ncbi:response regulator transcription factor [Streptomyces sp. NPDC056468]|uniref:response regulator transcription factor n=1 Tax=Streptomyces sp. NPDC056468 TaxID=3345830 RepID=UPI0036C492BA